MSFPLRNAFIAVFLTVQVVLPLRFYACGDGYDERFSWRMFSPTRMVECAASFTADGRRVRMGQRFHQAWLSLAQRGRRDVIDGMAAALCRDQAITSVNVRLTCRDVAGNDTVVLDGADDVCAPGGAP